MLRSVNDLQKYAIRATDGGIGQVKDLYFDDLAWVVRYLVVDTGTWLSGRHVLISPIAVGEPNWAERVLPVSITKEQVRNSPDIDTHQPVSRQSEISFLGYYGYPDYWGAGGYPRKLPAAADHTEATTYMAKPLGTNSHSPESALKGVDPQLRSCTTVLNHHVIAADGDIGRVHGLLVDERTWAIRYIIVNTGNWWLGHKVVMAPEWIEDVSWPDSILVVDTTRRSVQDAPAYVSVAHLDRSQEIGIYAHYGRAGYWMADIQAESRS